MSSIELRHLRYFLAVAETASFTRAAERMEIAQPSISNQIRDLEAALGTSLFDRLGKAVRLTDAGERFRAHAEAVLQKMDEATRAMDQVRGLSAGHLQIGVMPAAAVAWLPEALERFTRAHPGVTVGVYEAPANEVEVEVEAGRLEMGVGFSSNASPHVTYERLCTDQISLVCARTHPLASAGQVAVEDLETVELVLLPPAFNLRRVVEEVFRGAQLRPRVAIEVGSVHSALEAVARTGKASVLPSIVLNARPDLRLRGVRIRSKLARFELGVLWPQRAERSPAARAFGGILGDVARANPPAF